MTEDSRKYLEVRLIAMSYTLWKWAMETDHDYGDGKQDPVTKVIRLAKSLILCMGKSYKRAGSRCIV